MLQLASDGILILFVRVKDWHLKIDKTITASKLQKILHLASTQLHYPTKFIIDPVQFQFHNPVLEKAGRQWHMQHPAESSDNHRPLPSISPT